MASPWHQGAVTRAGLTACIGSKLHTGPLAQWCARPGEMIFRHVLRESWAVAVVNMRWKDGRGKSWQREPMTFVASAWRSHPGRAKSSGMTVSTGNPCEVRTELAAFLNLTMKRMMAVKGAGPW